jgi:hypothetical protein
MKELIYRSIFDLPEEGKKILIRNEKIILGIFEYKKSENAFIRCETEILIKVDRIAHDCFWIYFDVSHEEIEEILKSNRLIKQKAEILLKKIIEDWINDSDCFEQEVLYYPTICYFLGKNNILLEKVTIQNIIEFLFDIADKKILGHFRNDDPTFNEKEVENYAIDFLENLLEDPLNILTCVYGDWK